MRTTRVLALVAALVASLVAIVPAQAASSSASDNAGTFIVTLKASADPRRAATDYDRRSDADVEHVYDKVLNGFAGRFSDGALGALRADGRVARIERDGVAKATAVSSWGLDRIDQRYQNLDQAYLAGSTGSGIHAYVIDTGIYAGHAAFGSRVGTGIDLVDDDADADDCNGHGTHVAGTIGGAAYGVAPAVTLHGVRVLNCRGSGSWSDVIAGMNWVANRAQNEKAVANLSLGGSNSSSVNQAASDLSAVATVAVAAGNSNANACNYSPASASGVLTVGATTSTDVRASYSNYGTCVELFAPGSSITSAWIGGTTASNTISGTSMASPHVAGVAALLAQGLAAGSTSRSTIWTALTTGGNVTTGVVTSAGTGSPNRLLFNGSQADHDPTVVISGSCGSTTCSLTATGRHPDGAGLTFAWTNASAGNTVGPDQYGVTKGFATAPATGGHVVTVTVTELQSDGATAGDTAKVSCQKKRGQLTCSVS